MKFGFEHDRDDEMAEMPSEQTPLLATASVAPASDLSIAEATTAIRWSETSTAVDENTAEVLSRQSKDDLDKPLPVKQILLLCFARVCEPIAFFSIFPFINQMCAKNGNLQPADTGFYSGLIESLFSLTQMSTMIIWGRLSDRFGRKPCLFISLIGVGFFTGLFGFAETIWQMIVFRCLAGVFSAAVITIRTMIGEHSTQKTQARAYSWFAFSGNIGIFAGPLIGGSLADPAKQWKGSFQRNKFFIRYPYALAGIAAGLVAFIAAGVVAVAVEETLAPRSDATDNGSGDTASSNSQVAKAQNPKSTWSLVKTPGVPAVLTIGAIINVLAFSYTAIMPVFWYEPVALGGFGFSEFYISLFLALTGAAQAVWLLLVFPPLQLRIGTGGVLRWCAYAYPVFFAANPALNALLRVGSQDARISFWVIAPVLLCVGVGISMCFTAIQLALNDINPSPQTLGTLNALALTIASGIRAFSPAAFTSLYAVGVGKQILKGYLAWVVMVVIAFGYIASTYWLPAKAEGKVKRSTANESEGP